MALRHTQTAPGTKLQVLHLDIYVPLAVEHGPDLLPEMMGIDHYPLDPASAELGQGADQQGSIKDRKERLGTFQGIREQTSPEARGQNHGFHDICNPDG
jgi:hypothetical protein